MAELVDEGKSKIGKLIDGEGGVRVKLGRRELNSLIRALEYASSVEWRGGENFDEELRELLSDLIEIQDNI